MTVAAVIENQGRFLLVEEQTPEGIYLGGNEMAMTPRSLLAFGELYRRAGLTASGERLLSQDWIEASWTPRTRSRYTGHGYGYGWFVSQSGFVLGRGYGGQIIAAHPERRLAVAAGGPGADEPARVRGRDRGDQRADLDDPDRGG